MRSILITGSEGYIGTNLKMYLSEFYPQEYDVHGFDIVEGWDLMDFEDVSERFGEIRPEIVIHLGAVSGLQKCDHDPDTAFQVNVVGTWNVCEQADFWRTRVLFASSFAPAHDSFYGTTKKIGEMIVRYFDFTSMRFSNVYGGEKYLEMKNSVISKFVKSDPMQIHGNGDQTRDFIHVNEVCRMIVNIMNRPDDVYNLCTGVQTSINDLSKLVLKYQKNKGVDYINFQELDHGDHRLGNSISLDPSFKSYIKLEDGLKTLIEVDYPDFKKTFRARARAQDLIM